MSTSSKTATETTDYPHVGHPSRPFIGDFDLLPIAAQLAHGEVPTHPTGDDFQIAAMNLGDSRDAADLWHLEAIRERRLHPGRLLQDARRDINARVASRLHALVTAAR